MSFWQAFLQPLRGFLFISEAPAWKEYHFYSLGPKPENPTPENLNKSNWKHYHFYSPARLARSLARFCRLTRLARLLQIVALSLSLLARWRGRSSAALWIRTGPEGAQLRVGVQRHSVSTKVFCSLSVGSLSTVSLSSS